MTTKQNLFPHNAGYLINITGDTEYLTPAIIEQLKAVDENINSEIYGLKLNHSQKRKMFVFSIVTKHRL